MKSIADLAEHIKYLDKNETAYSDYFDYGQVFCQLCQALNQRCTRVENPGERVAQVFGGGFLYFSSPSPVYIYSLNDPEKTYSDIFKWWRTQAYCIKKGLG